MREPWGLLESADDFLPGHINPLLNLVAGKDEETQFQMLDGEMEELF